jgi:hypothetical protein
MNELQFAQLCARDRDARREALRQLREISKRCKCERCKTTVRACQEALKRNAAA